MSYLDPDLNKTAKKKKKSHLLDHQKFEYWLDLIKRN